MGIENLLYGPLAKKINLFVLLAAIIAVLVFPLKKEIWYDETISILCSNGLSHDSPAEFASVTKVSSVTINSLNTEANVYKATVLDNGNSFLYNSGLHWFTAAAGRTMVGYTLFSKLCSIAVLIALFVLANLVMGSTIFTSLAIIFLATDINFVSMSHEVRAYQMATFFTIAAAIFFYKFMYMAERPRHLLLTGIFSLAAILCHFLSVYAVLVFIGFLLAGKGRRLFRGKNIAALAIPFALAAIYFYFSFSGLVAMDSQNATIQRQSAKGAFSIVEVLFRSMKLLAQDFKAIFPALKELRAIIAGSFAVVIGLYLAAVRASDNKTDKRNLHLLFILGASGSVFLALLSIKAHHYTSLYHRYHSFGIPFACLFTAYAISVIAWKYRSNKAVALGVAAVLLLPSVALYAVVVKSSNPVRVYNHSVVARQIVEGNIAQLGVPTWTDAFMVNCFLPMGYKIDYVRNEIDPNFTLYKDGKEERVPVLNTK